MKWRDTVLVALGLACLFPAFRSDGIAFLISHASSNPLGTRGLYLIYILSVLAGAVTASIRARDVERIFLGHSRAFPALSMLAGVACALVILSPATGMVRRVILVASLGMYGSWVAIALAAWGRVADVVRDSRHIVVSALIGLILSLIPAALGTFYEPVMVALLAAAPFVCGILHYVVFRGVSPSTESLSPSGTQPLGQTSAESLLATVREMPVKMIGLLVAFVLLGGVIRGFLNNGSVGIVLTMQSYYTHAAAVTLALFMTAALLRSGSVSNAFNIVFAIISLAVFVGLFLTAIVSAQDGTLSPIARSIVIAGRTCMGLYLWILLAIHAGPWPYLRVVAVEVCYVCVEAVASLTSYLLVPALATFVGVSLSDYLLVCSLLVAFMLVVTMFVFLFSNPLPATESQTRAHEQRCLEITRRYGLTEREADVLALVARGYSAKKIAETLGLSDSTVQGYIKLVYRKTGVHKKQDLIDLVSGDQT